MRADQLLSEKLVKVCTKCNQRLPTGEFTMTSRGYKPSCKSCERKRVREWAIKNPDKEREKSARRRSRGGGRTFDLSVREKLFEKQNGRCFYTGAILDLVTAHVDHRIPISRGGTNDFSNLALCTADANLLKHNKTDDEFRIWLTDRGLL